LLSRPPSSSDFLALIDGGRDIRVERQKKHPQLTQRIPHSPGATLPRHSSPAHGPTAPSTFEFQGTSYITAIAFTECGITSYMTAES
jgi:hypothetical protein